MTVYYHGGPTISGDWVLPPAETGTARVCHDEEWVYITPLSSLALTYASTCEGWVYIVVPDGAVEQDPGSILPSGQSLRCRRAQIVGRIRPPKRVLAQARGVVESLGYSPGVLA